MASFSFLKIAFILSLSFLKKIKKHLTFIYSSIVNVSLILYGGVICVYFLLCCSFVYFFDKACHFFVLPICILLLHVKLFKWLSEQMNSCHFKFHSKYCRQSAYSQTLLQVFALCRSMKKKWTENDKNHVVQPALYQIICLSLLMLNLNKIYVFIIWIICVSLLFAWYDFVLYFVFFHSPDVPNTLLPTTIIPSLTTATVTTTVAITTSPTTSATTSNIRGTVCFFVMAWKTH